MNSTTSGVTYLYDQYNNQTDQYQFDFGSAPALNGSCYTTFGSRFLQHTNTTYLTTGSYVAASTNLVGLPTETKVYDSGGNLNSDVKYGYDTFSVSGYSSLTGYASMTGHDSGYSASGVATRGNLTSVAQGLNTGGGGWLNSYLAYDIAGNVVATEDANSNVTKYSYTDNYSSYGGTPTYGHATSATNALSQTPFSAQYDYASGQTVLSKDINKTATSYAYGTASYSMDRLIQVKQAVGTGAEAWKGYTYNSPIDIVTKQDQVTKGDGVIVNEQFWDGLGRATTALADSGGIETDTTYDALGRVATVTNPYQPVGGFTP